MKEISLRYASVPNDWVEWHKDSFFFTESIHMIIVCIVTNQGLPNKIKLDKAGLAMCFFQINDGKEKGEIVWLYFGDVLFES